MAAKRQDNTQKMHALAVRGDTKTTTIVNVRETEADRGYAIGTLTICGTHFHCECIEVVPDKEQGQMRRAVNATYESRIEALSSEMDCEFTVTRFDERDWVIIITPHGD